MRFAYLAALVVSLAGVATIDHRWRLFASVRPRRAVAVLLAGILYFAAWDAVGIATGLFFRGGSPYLTGWLVGPQFPVEELFFLALLSWCTMLATLATLRRRPARKGTSA